MNASQLLRVFYGALVTAIVGFGPPLAILMLPAGAMFLLLLPLWSIVVVPLLFLGFLIAGRFAYAAGVALLAGAALMSPVGLLLAKGSINVVEQTVRTNQMLEDVAQKCAIHAVAPRKASARYDLLVVDDIDLRGEQNYDIVDAVAALTGMRVVRIERFEFGKRFGGASETRREGSGPCVGPGGHTAIDVSPRGGQRNVARLDTGLCLRTTKISDPSSDRTPALVARTTRVVVDKITCGLVEVVERSATEEVVLGRIYVDPFGGGAHPALPTLDGMPRGSWQTSLFSTILDEDLSDKSLLRRAAAKRK